MKIAIVNDLPMAVMAIRQVLAAATRHQVAWVAVNGAEAVDMCARERPDLILMDMIMPVMDGVEATRQIMARTPCAILIVTATVAGNSPKVFEALGAGALDAIKTPVFSATAHEAPAALLVKIDLMGKLIRGVNRKKTIPLPSVHGRPVSSGRDRLLAIGASAGGPMALAKVLGDFPADFPAAVIIIQHIDPQFSEGLAEWLRQQSAMPVRLAREGDKPVKGTVLVAGTGDHLVFTGANTLGYTPSPADYVYRPSVDVFFHSIAEHWCGETVGVLLTGMGRDGALGLKVLREAGHHTIAQDRASSIVYGMPQAAAQLEAAVEILPLDEIGPALKNIYGAPANRRATVPL